ncbi:hypothetical protein ACFDR9_001414, partial [Janthinobacterium sp. CG_23.3]
NRQQTLKGRMERRLSCQGLGAAGLILHAIALMHADRYCG